MLTTNKQNLLPSLLILICMPYLLSFLKLTIEITSICETESTVCAASLWILGLTAFYTIAGIFSAWWAFKKLKYWRVVFWSFWVLSAIIIAYDFYKSPGDLFWETVQIKTYSLQVLVEKRELITATFLFWKDFLNFVFLLLAGLIVVGASTVKARSER